MTMIGMRPSAGAGGHQPVARVMARAIAPTMKARRPDRGRPRPGGGPGGPGGPDRLRRPVDPLSRPRSGAATFSFDTGPAHRRHFLPVEDLHLRPYPQCDHATQERGKSSEPSGRGRAPHLGRPGPGGSGEGDLHVLGRSRRPPSLPVPVPAPCAAPADVGRPRHGDDGRVDAQDRVAGDRAGAEAGREDPQRPVDQPSRTASWMASGMLAEEALPTCLDVEVEPVGGQPGLRRPGR